jgi:hypothetical protein
MRHRRLLAVPAALLLSVVFAGTALATHCGNTSKPDGAGQHVVLLVNPVTEGFTILAGANKNGKFTGGFADVYIDADLSGTISTGDVKINDTYLLSMHSGLASPGQDEGGLAVLPAIRGGADPAGAARGAGFADVSIVP